MARTLRLMLAAAAVSAAATATVSPAGVAPGHLRLEDIGDRLRVFAMPGDYKLQSSAITAVVRRKDGWLTELWQNRPTLPTVDQLGTTTNIDGLWQLHPIVEVGDDSQTVRAYQVAALPDGVRADARVEVSGETFLVSTTFRLDPQQSTLRMTTSYRVEGDHAVPGVRLGDAFKWGNVAYYVSARTDPVTTRFKGKAHWVGRRGAGGDLMLRTAEGTSMWVELEARIRGFQPTISSYYHRGTLAAGATITAHRELAYQPLPLPEPREQPTRRLLARVRDEAGAPLAAKLTITRRSHQKPPFPYDGGLTGADRFAWTGNGKLEVDLPPGRYDLLFTAGIERDAERHTLWVRPNAEPDPIDVKLPRVIETPGWIGADLHLHQAPSVDADVSLPARVVAVAAEGVELAVATDHYVVTDLAPTVEWLRERGVLSVPLQTMAGSEVSTLGNRFGHFNVFPLDPGENVLFLDTTPKELFADARRRSPGGILQVNHPRWHPSIAYFSYFQVDPQSGEPGVPGYDPSFDTLEVYNGDDAHDLKRVKQVLADWIVQLGRGYRYTATGSSDSHKLAFLDPGLPRTLIHHGSEASDARDVEADPRQVLRALRAGKALVTSGPIIDARVGGAGPGETARGLGQQAMLELEVRAAPWIDVRHVEVLLGGSGRRVAQIRVPRSRAVQRLKRRIPIRLTAASFLIVTAEGDRELPNASRAGTRPFAFCNPIWLEP